jgi:hypothetical protein
MDSQADCPTTERQSLQQLARQQSLYPARRLWLKSRDLIHLLKEKPLRLQLVLRAQKPGQQVRPPSQALPLVLQRLAPLARQEQAMQRLQREQLALGRA